MNKIYEITFRVSGDYSSVKELNRHIKQDVIPDAFNVSDAMPEKDSFCIYQRLVQGFCAVDVTGQAETEGRTLTDEEVDEVLDMMENTFDANTGINWDFISFCIGEVLP